MTLAKKRSKQTALKRIFCKRTFPINVVYYSSIAFCAIVHMIYITLFSKLGITPMVIFNFFSALLYLALLVSLFKKKYIFTITAAYIEVCIHSIAATIFVGWEFGFSLQILTLIPLTFYFPFKNKFTAFIYSVISAAVFISLKAHTISNLPVYIGSQGKYEHFLYIFNCMTSILPMLLFSAVYSTITRDSQNKLSEKNKNLLQLANVDPLTGMLNRRSMVTRLEQAITYREKCGYKFALAIGDIDDFKKINDNYGHACGDYVLKSLSSIIINFISDSDAVCRWGGEEILILFSNPNNSALKTEELRKRIQEYRFVYNNNLISVTMTFGVCASDINSSISDILLHADRNLYIGKNSGKNCIVDE